MIFILDNNRGSVMSIALLMLVLLTTIVIFMSRTSTTDVQIAANARYAMTAFYIADAGAYGHAKIVGKALDLGHTPTFGGTAGVDLPYLEPETNPLLMKTYIVSGGVNDFYEQVMGFAPDSEVDDDMQFGGLPGSGNEDIEFQLNGYEINVGIKNEGSTPLFGGGAEFGSGSMGVGSGAAGGGVAIAFTATSIGEGPKNSRSTVVVNYRKIPGTAGGL